MLKTISLNFHDTAVDFLFYQNKIQENSNNILAFHKHLNYEIHFALNGFHAYEFADKNIILRKNQMLIIPPGTLHKTIISRNKAYEFTVLTLKLSAGGNGEFYNYFLSAFDKNALKCLDINENIMNSVLKLNNDILNDRKDCLQTIYLTSCAANILHNLCSAITESTGEYLPLKSKQHFDVEIENLVNSNASLYDIANKINYSTRQSERLIKKIYGKSLSELREEFKW